MKKQQWKNQFYSLDPVQQLELANEISEELKDNERLLVNVTEYNKAMSKKVTLFFDEMIKKANVKQGLDNLRSVLDRYQSLSEEKQEIVIRAIVSSIEQQYKVQEQEHKVNICQQEGHSYTDWNYYTWSEYKTCNDPRWLQTGEEHFEVECHCWSRKCTRCGFVDESEYEPEEVKENRLEQEKKDKIKRLEIELKTLKSK